jgi:hypothetical protein
MADMGIVVLGEERGERGSGRGSGKVLVQTESGRERTDGESQREREGVREGKSEGERDKVREVRKGNEKESDGAPQQVTR